MEAADVKKECFAFHARYGATLARAVVIPTARALHGEPRDIPIIDTERGVALWRDLEVAAAKVDTWRSPLLAATAVELRRLRC